MKSFSGVTFVFVLLRFRLYAFVEAAALRSIVLRCAGAPIATRVPFFFPFVCLEVSLFPNILFFHCRFLFVWRVVVVVFTLKTVLTSIQYLLFLTLQGEETNFRGYKLTQNKIQKNKNKLKKTQRISQHLRKNMIQVPKNNKSRKTRSKLGQENPKKEAESIAPNSEAESQTK